MHVTVPPLSRIHNCNDLPCISFYSTIVMDDFTYIHSFTALLPKLFRVLTTNGNITTNLCSTIQFKESKNGLVQHNKQHHRKLLLKLCDFIHRLKSWNTLYSIVNTTIRNYCSYFTILSTDSKVRITFYSITNSTIGKYCSYFAISSTVSKFGITL